MKPTKPGELTIIHDPDEKFGLDHLYLHVRVKQVRDVSLRASGQKHWVLTFEEAARMEARAERSMDDVPDEARDNVPNLFIYLGFLAFGIIVGLSWAKWF